MRLLHSIALFVVTLCAANAHDPAIRLMMDAPGPGYRDMAATVKPEMDLAIPRQATLTFEPKDITTVTLIPADKDLSQIQIAFRPEAFQRIKEYIEFNKAKVIRVEIGDYTLPLDIKKTLPWSTGLWLEARPTAKAKTILETLTKYK